MKEITSRSSRIIKEYLTHIESEIDDITTQIEPLDEDLYRNLSEEQVTSFLKRIHIMQGLSAISDTQIIVTLLTKLEDLFSRSHEYSLNEFKEIFSAISSYIQRSIIAYREGENEIEKFLTFADEKFHEVKKYKARVLLVDATESIFKMVSLLAKEYNFELIRVNNGLNALLRSMREKYDVIISSVELKDLDGESLFSGINSMEGLNKNTLKVLITSQEKKDCENIVILKKELNLREKLTELFGKEFNDSLDNWNIQKILCVEDEPMIQKIMEKVFHLIPGCDVDIVSSVADARNQIQEKDYDLILLDYFLKDEVGTELITYMNEKRFEFPYIFMTSSPERISPEFIQNSFCKGVLRKPIKASRLVLEIDRLCAKK